MQGQIDVWSLLKKLYNDTSVRELEEIYGVCTIAGVVNRYTAEGAVKRYEDWTRERTGTDSGDPVRCTCGSRVAIITEYDTSGDPQYRCVCQNCGRSTTYYKTRLNAVRVWNLFARGCDRWEGRD